jgi:hypothetical protein
VFIDPPMAIARLGGSTSPLQAYEWGQSLNPRTEGETVITPTWSLNVLQDDTVEAIMPTEISFKDGDLIKPMCPFFEVWAMVSEQANDDPATWEEQPLTTGLLQANGVTESALRLRLDAKNRKAARRADDPALVFGTFPPVSVRGDDHAVKRVNGVSPPSVAANRRMIPPTNPIPLGSVQIMRPKAQPPAPTAWSEVGIRLDVIRFRFTPAKGEFYGPPDAATTTPPAVKATTNDFLARTAGWLNSPRDARPNPLRVLMPPDTVDVVSGSISLGVIDDTCEARAEIVLTLPVRAALTAHATIFVSPPDFGPDRRPFVSLADELNDRAGDALARNAAMTPEDRDRWVEDLFERISEHVSLFNVDYHRSLFAASLPASRLRPAPGIAGDRLPEPTNALGRRDALRNPSLDPLPDADGKRPLPLSDRARERHRALSDLDFLIGFLDQSQGRRLLELVRGPFELEDLERASGDQTMRMPPFMRNSNGNPLTLTAWQYALLRQWIADTVAPPAVEAVAPVAGRAMPAFAARRRQATLERLGRRAPR